MRGALLVLALLVTQALGVKMAETCPIFYDVFFAVANGNELLLDLSLTKVNATEPERTAMKKIQDCYVENGLISRVLDGLVMMSSEEANLSAGTLSSTAVLGFCQRNHDPYAVLAQEEGRKEVDGRN
uniref:Uncharacterized protein n=1 Tax=Felis catus TaxID=9685 RepID=A0ABI7XMV4_FELCA